MAKREGRGLTMGSKGRSASLHAPEPGRYVNMRAETLYTPLEMDKDSNDK